MKRSIMHTPVCLGLTKQYKKRSAHIISVRSAFRTQMYLFFSADVVVIQKIEWQTASKRNKYKNLQQKDEHARGMFSETDHVKHEFRTQTSREKKKRIIF